MKRSSRQAMLFAFMLALSGPVAAIGVNNMVAWSASDKPLRMDIELTDLGAARAADVTVRVASAADHARLGLTRPAWADDVSFRVLASSDQRVIVRASTSQPVSGDSVNFLVEIQALGGGSLQQLASSLSDSASPLASPSARPVERQPWSSSASDFADKPVTRPRPKAKPVAKAAPAPVAAPAAAPEPAPAPAPAPVPVAKAAPAPVPVAKAAPAAAPAPAATPAAATTAAAPAAVADSTGAAPVGEAVVDGQAVVDPAVDATMDAAAPADDATMAAADTMEATETSEPEAAPEANQASLEGPTGQMELLMIVLLGLMLGGAFLIEYIKHKGK